MVLTFSWTETQKNLRKQKVKTDNKNLLMLGQKTFAWLFLGLVSCAEKPWFLDKSKCAIYSKLATLFNVSENLRRADCGVTFRQNTSCCYFLFTLKGGPWTWWRRCLPSRWTSTSSVATEAEELSDTPGSTSTWTRANPASASTVNLSSFTSPNTERAEKGGKNYKSLNFIHPVGNLKVKW